MELEYSKCVSSTFNESSLEIGAELLGEDPSGAPMKCAQPLGLLARPRDPAVDSNGQPTDGAGLLHWFEGGEAFAIPTTDPRALLNIPPVKKGGTAIYSSPGGCAVFDGDNGGYGVLVPIDAKRSKNHSFSMDPVAGCLQLRHANGEGVTVGGDTSDSVTINAKNGQVCIVVNNDGITLNGTTVFNGGMAMGNVASAQPVPLAPALQAWEAQIAEIVGKLGAAVNGIVPGSVDPNDLAQLVQLTIQAVGAAGRSSKLSASP